MLHYPLYAPAVLNEEIIRRLVRLLYRSILATQGGKLVSVCASCVPPLFLPPAWSVFRLSFTGASCCLPHGVSCVSQAMSKLCLTLSRCLAWAVLYSLPFCVFMPTDSRANRLSCAALVRRSVQWPHSFRKCPLPSWYKLTTAFHQLAWSMILQLRYALLSIARVPQQFPPPFWVFSDQLHHLLLLSSAVAREYCPWAC